LRISVEDGRTAATTAAGGKGKRDWGEEEERRLGLGLRLVDWAADRTAATTAAGAAVVGVPKVTAAAADEEEEEEEEEDRDGKRSVSVSSGTVNRCGM
jgi:hypothetical protein